MNFSIVDIWALTKSTVATPDKAFRQVLAMRLPVETSFMLLILAGVVSGIASGFMALLIGAAPLVIELEGATAVVVDRAGPFWQGLYAALSGLVLGLAVFWVGRRLGGRGSLAGLLSVTAALQLVMVVILLGQTIAALVMPLLSLLLTLLGFYVFLRGLAHGVNEGHGFESLGRSALVIGLSFMIVLLVFLLAAGLGLGPRVEVIQGV